MTFTLYKLYDLSESLLYVGFTSNLGRRLKEHSEKAWFQNVVGIVTAEFDDEQFVREAELLAIRTEHPRHNVVGSKRKTGSVVPLTNAQLRFIAGNPAITGEMFRVFMYMLPDMCAKTPPSVTHASIAKGLGMHRPAVTKAINRLVAAGIILKGEERTYRMNPGMGWKGDLAKQAVAEQEHIKGHLSVVRP